MNYSESDLDSIDFVPVPTNTQLASCMSSYHKRQAFGTSSNYAQISKHDPRGETSSMGGGISPPKF
jgi:hypothetical protein